MIEKSFNLKLLTLIFSIKFSRGDFMCCKGFFKRVVPFFMTFAVGLFIASFFVTIVAPNFRFVRGMRSHRQNDRMMQFENQRLSEENSRLKYELSERDRREMTNYAFENDFRIPPQQVQPARLKTVPYPGR